MTSHQERAVPQHPYPLSVLQEILLTTDGTVTTILEAYARERMTVVKLEEVFGPCRAEHASLLAVSPDSPVLTRDILLKGSRSAVTYLYANSVMVPDRLPAGLLDDLMSTETPLGQLLAYHRVETRREIVCSEVERGDVRGEYFGITGDELMFSRTYKILFSKLPIIAITEKFPRSLYREVPAGDG